MRTIIFALSMVIGMSASAQFNNNDDMQTIFGNDRSFGGFIGFGSKMTEFNGQGALMLGGEINAVFGHALNIGFAGYGLVTDVYGVNTDDEDRRLFYEIGYGGLNIEPVFFSKSAIHFSAPILVGAGGVGESRSRFIDIDAIEETPDPYPPHFYNSDFFLVFEPSLQAEVNLLRFVRVYGGAGYRFVTDVDLPNTGASQLGGFSANFGIRLGWF